MRLSALLALALLVPAQAPATPQTPAGDPVTPGALQATRPDGTLVEMPLRHTSVAIEVTAFLARATIEQTFANPFDHPVEAVYTFPLAHRAAVDDFELVVGDRTIRGAIKRREEARQVYEEARATGYQAALLEQERPNIFTQSVSNLEPGGEVRVRIRTVETLPYERGVYRLTFPLVVGPRYIPGGAAGLGTCATEPVSPTPSVPDAPRITPPVLLPGFRSGHDVDITVTLDAGVPLTNLSSPSHRIQIERPAPSAARVRLAPEDSIPNKDFLLSWSVSSDRPAVGLLAHKDGLDGFFTLLVQPKGEVSVEEAAPKEIVIVMDTSGSMSGIPLEASKRFVRKALLQMGRNDTFNLIRFSGDNEVFSAEPLPNTRADIDRGIAWMDRLQGGGGTEMMQALRAAFARPADPNRVRMVVFLTDGYVGNDAEILASIGSVVGSARIYTVGIGSAVNRYLLDRMADLGRGAFVSIRPDAQADEAVESFRSWVTKPYLTDLSIDWGALQVADVSPDRPHDLCSGQTLALVGRYLAAGTGDVVLRGRLGGRYWEQRLHVALPEREGRHDALGSLWARGRIEEMLLASPAGATDSIRAEVTSLALAYRLMSPFTSFVAVDDARVVNPGGQAPTVHQALPMPEGVSFEGVFGKDGPAALKAGGEGVPEDHFDADKTDSRSTAEQGWAGGTMASAKSARLESLALAPPPSPSVGGAEEVEGGVAGGVLSANYAPGGIRGDVSDEEAPVSGRSYQGVLSLAPGVNAPAGLSNVHGARERDFKIALSGIGSDESSEPIADGADRLRELALRVLADLADDGRLTSSEGKPALAALLAAQRPSGAIAEDVTVHAIATWALFEAATKMEHDPWVTGAATKAVEYLVRLGTPDGWPARAGGPVDAEASRWARLALHVCQPLDAASGPLPQGEPSPAYARLRNALVAARTGVRLPPVPGSDPFDRLLASIAGGHLKITR